nr:uncharacterized protein LOC113726068 isoform X1 [Coffea arabica]
MSILLALFVATFTPLVSFLESTTALTSQVSTRTALSGDSPTTCDCLFCEVKEAQFKLAQLESALVKSSQDLNAKGLHARECEKKIEDLNLEIDLLKTALKSFEDVSSHAKEKLSALEGELQLLWSVSRRNNFEIHTLEHRVHDAEKRLNAVTSKAEKMADIVSEQWIQIQQLEQAVQMIQVRALKVRRQLRTARCPFVKFVRSLFAERLEMLKGILDPYIATGRSVLERSPHHLQRTFSTVEYCHHWLQGCIKQSMLRNEFTAVLANDEVVFFLVVHFTSMFSSLMMRCRHVIC